MRRFFLSFAFLATPLAACAAILGLDEVGVVNDSGVVDGPAMPLEGGADGGDAMMTDAADGGARIEQVIAGTTNSCVILENGELWCWGSTECGVLGPATGDDVC